MRVPQRLGWSGCFLVLLLAAPMARADGGGTITISGAIVEPTCEPNVERVAASVAAAAPSGKPHVDTCHGPGTAVAPSAIYTVSMVHLSRAEPDRVLKYFNDYVRAEQANAPDPMLITQTYE